MRAFVRKKYSVILLVILLMLFVMVTFLFDSSNFVFAEQNDAIINELQYVVDDYSKNPEVIIDYDKLTYSNLKWSSSDEKIATVDNEGKVSILDYGKVIITCTDTVSGDYDSCEVYSSIKNFDEGLGLYALKIDGEDYYFSANENTKLNDVTTFASTLFEKENAYVVRDKNGAKVLDLDVEIGRIVNDDSEIAMNYIYTIEKIEGSIEFNINKTEAEYNQKIELSNIKVINTNYIEGKIGVKALNGEDVIVNQNDKYFYMPKSNIEVTILVDTVNLTLDGESAYVTSKKGITSASQIKIERCKQNSLNNVIQLPEDRDYLVCYKLDVSNYNKGEECIISFKVPNEMLGRDGTTVITVENGVCVEKAITIKDGYMYFATTDPNDFAIIGKQHPLGANLIPAIIVMLFLNALATVGIIILSVKWVDNKYQEQRRKDKAYSTLLPVLVLVCAGMSILGRQIFILVFYSILLLAKIVVLIWLLIRLTEKGVVWIDE